MFYRATIKGTNGYSLGLRIFLTGMVFLLSLTTAAQDMGIDGEKPAITLQPALSSEAVGETAGAGAVGNGVYTYQIPISVPAGRGNLQPQLSLRYNSQGGNGMVGVGWSIAGLSMLSRCGKDLSFGYRPRAGDALRPEVEGIQFDNSDVLCLDGQRLVVTRGTYLESGSEYRTEIDSFVKVEASSTMATTSPRAPSSFKVYRKDGLIATYEAVVVTRTRYNADGDTASTTQVVLSWPIKRLEDRSGNAVVYSWGRNDDSGALRPVDIKYTSCSNCGYRESWTSRVRFHYENRADVMDGYLNGVHLRTHLRLRAVETRSRVGGTADTRVSIYRLKYRHGAVTQRSLLREVSHCDREETCLNPKRFTWQGQSDIAFSLKGFARENEYVDSLVQPGYGSSGIEEDLEVNTAEVNYALLDANGDGNTDIVLKRWPASALSEKGRLYRTDEPNSVLAAGHIPVAMNAVPEDLLLLGDGTGFFSKPVKLGLTPPTSGCRQSEIADIGDAIVADIDADGRQELVAPLSRGCPFYRPPPTVMGTGYRVTPSFSPVAFPPTSASRVWAVLAFDRDKGTLVEKAVNGITAVRWQQTQLALADVNGDGLPDLFTRGLDANAGQWTARLAKLMPGDGADETHLEYQTEDVLTQLESWPPAQENLRRPFPYQVLDVDADGREELEQHSYDGTLRSFSLSRQGHLELRIDDGGRDRADLFQFDLDDDIDLTAIDWGQPTTADNGNTPRALHYIDINGDGLRDQLFLDGAGEPTWLLRINTGAGFLRAYPAGADTQSMAGYSSIESALIQGERVNGKDIGLRVADMNGDGLQDLLLLYKSGEATSDNIQSGEIRVRYSTGVDLGPAENLGVDLDRFHRIGSVRAWPFTKVADVNGDGLTDIVDFVTGGTNKRRLVVYGRDTVGGIDVITRVLDGNTEDETAEWIDYDHMAFGTNERLQGSHAQTHLPDTLADDPFDLYPQLTCRYPEACGARGRVVRGYANYRSTREVNVNFQYYGARTDVKSGLGLGFRAIVENDRITGQRTTHFFDQSPVMPVSGVNSRDSSAFSTYPLAGQPVVTISELSEDGLANRLDNTLRSPEGTRRVITVRETHFAGYPLRLIGSWETELTQDQIYPMAETVRQDLRYYEVHTAGTLQVKREAEMDYDNYGNLIRHREVLRDLQARAGVQLETGTEVEIEYLAPDETGWLVGLPQRKTQTHTTNDPACSGVDNCDHVLQTAEFSYDERGLLREVIREPDGDRQVRLTTRYERDSAGLIRVIIATGTNAEGEEEERVSKIDYDSDGIHPQAMENALGQVTWLEYDNEGLDRLQAAVPPEGGSQNFVYDMFGRMRGQSDEQGQQKTLHYGNDFIDITSNNGESRRRYFDARRREILAVNRAFNDASRLRGTAYDALGNVAEESYSWLGASYSFALDALAKAGLQQHHQLGNTVTLRAGYDALGRKVLSSKGDDNNELRAYNYPAFAEEIEQDQLTNPVHRIVDAAGNPREITFGRGSEASVMSYGYTALGHIASVSVNDRLLQLNSYDNLGRRTAVTTFNSSDGTPTLTSTQAYSPFGEVLEERGLRNVNYRRDGLGRVVEMDHPDIPGTITYEWDTQALGKLGRMSNSENPGSQPHETRFYYNAQGRLTERQEITGGLSLFMGYQYDDAGRLTVLRYPDMPASEQDNRPSVGGVEVHYNYFVNNLLRSVCLGPCSTNPNTYLWRVNGYHAGTDKIAAVRNGDALTLRWNYHPSTFRLMESQVEGVTSGPAPRQIFRYMVNGQLDYRESAGIGEDYGYDSLNRLIRYTRRNTSSGPLKLVDAEYYYDDEGNLREVDTGTSHQSPDWPLVREVYDYRDRASSNAPSWTNGIFWNDLLARIEREDVESGEVTAESFRYDTQGRVRRAGDYRVPAQDDYNGFNLPVRISNDANGEVNYLAYDALGRRTRKWTDSGSPSGTQEVTYLDRFFEARNFSTSNTLSSTGRVRESLFRVYAGSTPIAEITRAWDTGQTSVRYLYTDHQGSITFISEGARTHQYGYFPFGRRWGDLSDVDRFASIGYTGHRHDDDLGLINMNGRMYDAHARRFLTRDPVQRADVWGGYNPYAYVRNDPMNLTDPTGFCDAGYDDLNNGCSDPVSVGGDGNFVENAARKVCRFFGGCQSAEERQREAREELERRQRDDERRAREREEQRQRIEARRRELSEAASRNAGEAARAQAEYERQQRVAELQENFRAGELFRAEAFVISSQSGGDMTPNFERWQEVQTPADYFLHGAPEAGATGGSGANPVEPVVTELQRMQYDLSKKFLQQARSITHPAQLVGSPYAIGLDHVNTAIEVASLFDNRVSGWEKALTGGTLAIGVIPGGKLTLPLRKLIDRLPLEKLPNAVSPRSVMTENGQFSKIVQLVLDSAELDINKISSTTLNDYVGRAYVIVWDNVANHYRVITALGHPNIPHLERFTIVAAGDFIDGGIATSRTGTYRDFMQEPERVEWLRQFWETLGVEFLDFNDFPQ